MQVTRHCAVTYRIYPDKAQAGLIDRTIGCARLVYNLMLETRIDAYNRTGKSCNPTPAQYKDEYPFLREVDSLALCNAQLNVAKAYNNFFRDPKHVGFPKYKAKHRSAWRYTTNNNNRNIRLIEGGRYLKLPKDGVMRARQHKTIPDDWKLKSSHGGHLKSGGYTATILFEYETQPPEPVRPAINRRLGLRLPRPVRVQRRANKPTTRVSTGRWSHG